MIFHKLLICKNKSFFNRREICFVSTKKMQKLSKKLLGDRSGRCKGRKQLAGTEGRGQCPEEGSFPGGGVCVCVSFPDVCTASCTEKNPFHGDTHKGRRKHPQQRELRRLENALLKAVAERESEKRRQTWCIFDESIFHVAHHHHLQRQRYVSQIENEYRYRMQEFSSGNEKLTWLPRATSIVIQCLSIQERVGRQEPDGTLTATPADSGKDDRLGMLPMVLPETCGRAHHGAPKRMGNLWPSHDMHANMTNKHTYTQDCMYDANNLYWLSE